MISLIALQQAIYARLTGDAVLMSKVKGIFDAVPAGQAFPYVTIGEASEVPFNAFNRKGRDAALTIHIWSRYLGFKESLDILRRLNELLDGVELPLSGMTNVLLTFESAITMLDQDGMTRHIPIRYRAVTQE